MMLLMILVLGCRQNVVNNKLLLRRSQLQDHKIPQSRKARKTLISHAYRGIHTISQEIPGIQNDRIKQPDN